MSKFIFLSVVMLYSSFALAGTATGKITTIFIADGSSAVLFKLDSRIQDTPRCNEAKRFSIELRKPGGTAAYMAILEAKREKYQVSVEGLNTCTNEWKSEDIKAIILN